MYYYHYCPYCGKMFYTFANRKQDAAWTLFHGIKKHMIDYNEDDKEFTMDEAESIEEWQMYKIMIETTDEPKGGYEL